MFNVVAENLVGVMGVVGVVGVVGVGQEVGVKGGWG